MIGALGLLLIIVSIILLVVGLFKKSPGLKSKAFKGFGLGVGSGRSSGYGRYHVTNVTIIG